MIFTTFTLAGIGLCIFHHRVWGVLCLAVAVLALMAGVL